jgi:hypothetical protein
MSVETMLLESHLKQLGLTTFIQNHPYLLSLRLQRTGWCAICSS